MNAETNGRHPRDIHHAMAMLTEAYLACVWFHSIEILDGDALIAIEVNGDGPPEKPSQWMGHSILWRKASRSVTRKIGQVK